jgi:hypothetical protein
MQQAGASTEMLDGVGIPLVALPVQFLMQLPESRRGRQHQQCDARNQK